MKRTAALAIPIAAAALVFCQRALSEADRPPKAATAVAQAPERVPEGLTPEEKRDIDIFRRASSAVAFVTNIGLVQDFFSFEVEQHAQGQGTGFVWDQVGHLVTNYHVVQDGKLFSVRLGKDEYDAVLVGVAQDKDLAVLRIKAPANRLSPLPVGRSRDLLVGQRVLAVGNPFGLDHSLTVGVVSALGRELRAPNNRIIRDVIQTDAAINPGNSGGPLLDSSGRVIGVNSAIYSPSGANAGIGFAIPIDTVSRLVPQIIKNGRAVQPGIGIEALQDRYNQAVGIEGVAVRNVRPGSAAARAGLVGLRRTRSGRLTLGDVIVGVNGKTIRGSDDLLYAFEQSGVGASVVLRVERDGKGRDVSIQLADTVTEE